ncbi:hypothetical protein BZG36_03939 [Bifiguratus adelaidae]|uniref:Uncharacterized protein n=1 Tax=Bifiguratus adelaidae TaxID=1938954 RepID=A0A261XZZ8_9FUNG|nr:hypothetical protein BZG36_03939 [Bifiguratus adelaidae]
MGSPSSSSSLTDYDWQDLLEGRVTIATLVLPLGRSFLESFSEQGAEPITDAHLPKDPVTYLDYGSMLSSVAKSSSTELHAFPFCPKVEPWPSSVFACPLERWMDMANSPAVLDLKRLIDPDNYKEGGILLFRQDRVEKMAYFLRNKTTVVEQGFPFQRLTRGAFIAHQETPLPSHVSFHHYHDTECNLNYDMPNSPRSLDSFTPFSYTMGIRAADPREIAMDIVLCANLPMWVRSWILFACVVRSTQGPLESRMKGLIPFAPEVEVAVRTSVVTNDTPMNPVLLRAFEQIADDYHYKNGSGFSIRSIVIDDTTCFKLMLKVERMMRDWMKTPPLDSDSKTLFFTGDSSSPVEPLFGPQS